MGGCQCQCLRSSLENTDIIVNSQMKTRSRGGDVIYDFSQDISKIELNLTTSFIGKDGKFH
jgi:hypothetical protein